MEKKLTITTTKNAQENNKEKRTGPTKKQVIQVQEEFLDNPKPKRGRPKGSKDSKVFPNRGRPKKKAVVVAMGLGDE